MVKQCCFDIHPKYTKPFHLQYHIIIFNVFGGIYGFRNQKAIGNLFGYR